MRAARLWLPLAAVPFGLLAILPVQNGCVTGSDGGVGGIFNSPPIVIVTADRVRGIAPLVVRFDSSSSTDDGIIVSRAWDFGDGGTSVEISPTHTFTATGEYTVSLTLTDDQGGSASNTLVISVTEAPVPVIEVDRTTAPSAPATFTFDGSDSSDPDGSIVAYTWDFDDGSREVIPAVVHTFGSAGTFRVRLTVTDNTGVTASTGVLIQVGIPEPEIGFRLPGDDVGNIVVSTESPLWVAVDFASTAGVPYTITAGLDRDRDACDAQAALFPRTSSTALARLVGSEEPVTGVALTPDGAVAIVSARDGALRFFNTETGILYRTIQEDVGPLTCLAVSPDGARVAYGSEEGAVALRAVADGEVLRRFAGHGVFPVNAVAISPDGNFVASASDDATAIIWDADSGAGIVLDASDGGHAAPVNAVAYSPVDADVLATGSDDESAKVWRLSTQAVLRTFAPRFDGLVQVAGHRGAVTSVAFSNDGLVLVTGSTDATAILWDISSDREARVLEGHDSDVLSVAFSPTRQEVLTGSADGTARLWNADNAETEETYTPCESSIAAVAFSADGDQVLLGVAAFNQIQLDTREPGGDDLVLTVPNQLDLGTLPDEDVPGQFYLWTEIDTDRTEPIRTYAQARIQVVPPFTADLSADTPSVPLVSDQALVVAAPTTGRQVYNLGPLAAGDRLFLSFATTPGYEPYYDLEAYSLTILDAQEQVFATFHSDIPPADALVAAEPFIPAAPLTRSQSLVIGHDSPSYYVAVQGCPSAICSDDVLTPSLAIEVQREVGLTPRQQRIFLNFAGRQDLIVDGVGPLDADPFDAEDLNDTWGTVETNTIKQLVQQRLEDLFAGYNVIVYTDASALAAPYITIYFGGDSGDMISDEYYGAASQGDPRNQTLSGTALVLTNAVSEVYPLLAVSEFAVAFANIAAHLSGQLVGLTPTDGGANDVMDPDFMSTSGQLTSPAVEFTTSPPRSGVLPTDPLGLQNAPQILDEVIGTE